MRKLKMNIYLYNKKIMKKIFQKITNKIKIKNKLIRNNIVINGHGHKDRKINLKIKNKKKIKIGLINKHHLIRFYKLPKENLNKNKIITLILIYKKKKHYKKIWRRRRI